MAMASAPWTSIVLWKTQTPAIFSLLPTSSQSLSTPLSLCYPSLTATLKIKSTHFSSQAQPKVEEEPAIGDCLVYEEGIFDDPFLQNTRNFEEDGAQFGKPTKKDTIISSEILIPEKWLDIQKELNVTKKERRRLSQQLEYGRRVEKRRQALRPLNLPRQEEEYQNLKPLKPYVHDKPEPKDLEEDDKHEKSDEESSGETVRSRVTPRNPRMAVYGGRLEDISALFNSVSYQPGSADKSHGTRKLFSKEEKSLLNKRIPDLAIATSVKWHPLHTLASSGEFYLVNSLLKYSLDINAPDKYGLTVIHKAILGKKQAIFNFLLRESANPFVRDEEGATLMHYAVFTASTQVIKILLLYNVDINLQDNEGWTPLHLAVQSRRTDVVRLLLIKGADKTIRNLDGLTALDLCLHSGRDLRTYELIKILKEIP